MTATSFSGQTFKLMWMNQLPVLSASFKLDIEDRYVSTI